MLLCALEAAQAQSVKTPPESTPPVYLPQEIELGGGEIWKIPSPPGTEPQFRLRIPDLSPYFQSQAPSPEQRLLNIEIIHREIEPERSSSPAPIAESCPLAPKELSTPPCALSSKKTWRGLHRSPWFVTLELFAIQTTSILVFAALPRQVSGFSDPKAHNIFHYAAKGPHFDDDRWGFNYIGHPLAGSEYYLLLRNRKGTWWQALIYAAGWSGFWEYVTEGLYEQASIQDLIVTPLAGAALGEIRYQLRRALLDPKTGDGRSWPVQLLVIALDPIQAFSEAVPLDIVKIPMPETDPEEPCRE